MVPLCLHQLELLFGAVQEEMAEIQQERELDQQEHRARMQRAAQAADTRLAEYQDRKVTELEQIHAKLQDVLDKKNATIAQLRESLEAAHARLEAHEQEMRKQKLELFEQMKW